jgi:hypothetical protein
MTSVNSTAAAVTGRSILPREKAVHSNPFHAGPIDAGLELLGVVKQRP